MDLFKDIFNAFWVGGLICLIGQILIDKTKLQPGRILVLYVCLGCILGGIGIYKPIVEYAGAGATVPLTGFGYNLAKGVMSEIDKSGFVERFPELSLFYRLFSPLNSEMICIFPYFCPYAESAREIREIFS